MNVRPAWKNLVLAGGPGTGKSRVAAIAGRIYRDLGVLSSGHLVEVTRADLTGEYARDSAPLVQAARQPGHRRRAADQRRARLRRRILGPRPRGHQRPCRSWSPSTAAGTW